MEVCTRTPRLAFLMSQDCQLVSPLPQVATMVQRMLCLPPAAAVTVVVVLRPMHGTGPVPRTRTLPPMRLLRHTKPFRRTTEHAQCTVMACLLVLRNA